MALRRGSNRLRAAGPRRLTDWGPGPGDTGRTSLTSSSAVIMGGGVTPTTGPVTLIRTRGNFHGSLESVTAAADGMQGAFGICVVQAAAFAIGITAIPTPITELDSDAWVYHKFFGVQAHSAVEAEFNTSTVVRFDVDSKAMRKLDSETVLVAVVEVVMLGTAVLRVYFDSRMLFKS